MSLARFLKDLRFRIFYLLVMKRGVPLVTHGHTCQWTFNNSGIDSTSHILCAGAGHDISFEKELIITYGCKIVLLDPSPTGITTMKNERIPEAQLSYFPVGLAEEDGVLKFDRPLDPEEGSFRKSDAATGVIEFPCKSLSTLLAELKWSKIDLLKIDIEGAEYGVIREIVSKELQVKQLCVEFHYGPAFGYTRSEMIKGILALRNAGYQLVHRHHQDHTFLKRP